MLNKSKGPAMCRLVCSQTGCVLQKSGGWCSKARLILILSRNG
jgi:hypothetical protein